MEEPLFEQICSWSNIVLAYKNARKCKRYRKSCLSFEHNREEYLFLLQEEMRNLTYKVGKYKRFKVYEPKERDISALPFRDRIMQHAVYNVLNPIFDKTFMYDSYACRKNKGTLKAVDRISYFMNKEDCQWFLYCDVRKYFKSVNPFVLKKILERKVKEPSVLYLLYEVIDSSEESGIPIGNLLSQMFANIYLNDLDFYICHTIKPSAKDRYMDDFLLFFRAKHEAWEAKDKIEAFLSDYLCVNLNDKTYVGKTRRGLTFCGYKIKSNDKEIKQATIDRMERKEKAWENGKMTDSAFLDSISSAVGHCKGTSSYNKVCDVLVRALRHSIGTKQTFTT